MHMLEYVSFCVFACFPLSTIEESRRRRKNDKKKKKKKRGRPKKKRKLCARREIRWKRWTATLVTADAAADWDGKNLMESGQEWDGLKAKNLFGSLLWDAALCCTRLQPQRNNMLSFVYFSFFQEIGFTLHWNIGSLTANLCSPLLLVGFNKKTFNTFNYSRWCHYGARRNEMFFLPSLDMLSFKQRKVKISKAVKTS